jgi:hypothetical protein
MTATIVAVAVVGFVLELYAAVTVRDPGVVDNTGVMHYAAMAGATGVRLAHAFAIRRPLRPGVRLSQTFFVFDDGLSSVALYPYVAGPAVGSVTIELWLRESDGQRAPRLEQGRQLVRREEIPIASLRPDAPVTVSFRPQPSVQRWFEIVTFVSDDVRSGAFGLLATGGDNYERGTFRANDEIRAGDLMFVTSLHPTASIVTFRARLAAAGVPYPAFVWIAALAAPNIVFVFVALALARAWTSWHQAIDASQASTI